MIIIKKVELKEINLDCTNCAARYNVFTSEDGCNYLICFNCAEICLLETDVFQDIKEIKDESNT